MRNTISCIFSLIFLLPQSALADIPLSVDDLLTGKGKFKVDLSISYSNVDRQGVSVADPITVQTGPHRLLRYQH